MDFEVALARVLLAEGGESNDPQDPGGHTDHGITQRSYDDYCAKKGLPHKDVTELGDAEIKAFYREEFWDVVDGDELPDIIAFQGLDFAVNSSPQTAVRYLQRAAGVADDGHVGPVTLAALKTMPAAVLLVTFLALRLQYLTRCKAWAHDGAGWANRIANDLLLGAQDLLA